MMSYEFLNTAYLVWIEQLVKLIGDSMVARGESTLVSCSAMEDNTVSVANNNKIS